MTPSHPPDVSSGPRPDTAAPDAVLPEAAVTDRLETLRAALAQTDPAAASGADELVERLTHRRSAGHVAAAYSAAHGHPLTSADPPGDGRRWAVSGRAALAASVALLLLATVVVAVALWPRTSSAPVDTATPVHDASTSQDDAAFPAPEHDGADSGPRDSAPQDGGAEGGAAPDPHEQPAAGPAVDAPADALGTTADPTVVVHVVGQVAAPGLVTLPAGSRVADAVEAADGATEQADLTALNLARAVVDGEQVHVPAPGEDVPPPAAEPPGDPDAGTPAAPVRVNDADAATLDALPGIGPVLAERIVAWRDQHGPFTRVDELAEVSGIGPVLLDELRDLVVV